MGTKLKKMLKTGARKRHTLSLKGIALLTKLAADKKVSGIPRCGPERHAALRIATEDSYLTVGIFRRDTGELLKPWERRTAAKSGLAPLRVYKPDNVQARPVARVATYIQEHAIEVPEVQPTALGHVAPVAVTTQARRLPRDRRMEDWSAEYALLQLKKSKGKLHVVRRSPVGAVKELARVKLDSGEGGRPHVQDVVRVFSFTLPNGWAKAALDKFNKSGLRSDWENVFHMKYHDNDPRRDEVKSTELGWSGFEGGPKGTKQGDAREAGVPYKLEAWLDPRGASWMDKYISTVLPRLWALCKENYPDVCAAMSDKTMAHLYGLFGTGWNKITVGVNNPTELHFDDKNFGITALLIVGLKGLAGGSHVLLGTDRAAAVIVEECEEGTVVFGDYASALHGNLATIAGTRFVVNAYCSANVILRITK